MDHETGGPLRTEEPSQPTASRGGETSVMIIRIKRSQDKNGNGIWVARTTVDGKRRQRTFAVDLADGRSVSAQRAALQTVDWVSGVNTVSDRRKLSLSAKLVTARYADDGVTIVLDFDVFDDTVRFYQNDEVTDRAVSFL